MAVAARGNSVERVGKVNITRFDVHQITQHAGMMVSFILLVVTGLPQKFNELAVSQWWVGAWGGIEVIRSVHRFSAWVIILVCVYHLLYLLYSTLVLKRPFPVKMLPARQDFINFYQEIGYFLGLRKHGPRMDRFHWREKFDYWAILWGMPVMAGSGFILMYPVLVSKVLPGWIVPAALIAHSDEAMLALTWIFMVHIFFSHFSPGIFPINTSIFTGNVTRERYRKEHPVEYNRLLAASVSVESVSLEPEPPEPDIELETVLPEPKPEDERITLTSFINEVFDDWLTRSAGIVFVLIVALVIFNIFSDLPEMYPFFGVFNFSMVPVLFIVGGIIFILAILRS